MLNKELDLRNALEHIISVSELGRGKASKVISDVECNKEQYIVVKNNKPQAIIMSIDEYSELQKLKEEYGLLQVASQRVAETNDDEYISYKDVINELDITDDELKELADDVEIE